VGSRIARRGRSAGIVRLRPSEPRPRRERAANSIDRYSLALQIIQVFPIVAWGTALLVTTTWLARALAGIGLLAGTVWAVRLERAGGLGALRRRADRDVPVRAVVTARLDDPPDGSAVPPAPSVIQGPDGIVLTQVTSECGEINIWIRLHPSPTVYRHRERRRKLRERHERPPPPRGVEGIPPTETGGIRPPRISPHGTDAE
jgi:hypothetical protein